MHRTRKANKMPIVEANSDSEDDIPLKKLRRSPVKKISRPEKKRTKDNASSSSESDIENYLQPINTIDLNSPFFNVQKKHEEEFNKIEKEIFSHVTRRLSDSDSDEELNEVEAAVQKQPSQHDLSQPSTSSAALKLNFQQLEDYTRKLEEAKKHVEKYNARKKAEERNTDISNLLAAGESKKLTLDNIKPEDLHSSDFESCDSEQEDWEEVKIKESQESKEIKEKSLVPKDGFQITVNMPETCRKKKGYDLLAAMKRRLNRIRKENQVYVHKVHLLCWIAHGNYVNDAINNTQILGLALSLLPSDKCYPSDRTDLSYLEQIVQWYKKTIKVTEKLVPKDLKLVNAIQLQINKKEVYNKKMLVYIFIAILRALGIQCRLVLSFQVEPLRPPVSELHSLAKESCKKEGKVKTIASSVKEEGSVKKDVTKKVKKTQKKDEKPKLVQKDKIKVKECKDEMNKVDLRNVTIRKKKEDEEDERKVKKENLKKSDLEKESGKKNASTSMRTVRSKVNDKKTDSKKGLEKKSSKEDIKKEISSVSSKKNKEPKSKPKTSEIKDETSKKDNKKKSEKQLKSDESKVKATRITKANTLTVKKDQNMRSKSEEHKSKTEKSAIKNTDRLTVKVPENRRSKSADTTTGRQTRSKTTTKKDIIKVKFPTKRNPQEIPQLDGINCSSDEENSFDLIYTFSIPQLDGADDNKGKKTVKAKKPNLKKLKQPVEDVCDKKTHPSRLKATTEEYNSENEFRPRSPFTKKNTDSPKVLQKRKVNLQKLKSPKTTTVHHSSSSKKQINVKNDIVNLIKGRITEQKHIDRSRTVKRKPILEDDSDSDYMQEPIKKKHHDSDSDLEYFVPKPKVKQRVNLRNAKVDQKIVSSESDLDKDGKKKKKGINVWVEVFLENEEKWFSVDVVHGQVHCINELYTRATHPVSYVVAWNNDNYLKDITMRYCRNFNTITRKLRVDAKWWEETLKPFREKRTARDKEEDDDLNRQQLDQPLPKVIAEYKNHPLYALRRHLLKFEEIYPPNIQPLGYVRGEPVYPRNCVYVCRSRDIWLKEAKVVKPGERPYKIVKARPKYDKLSNQIITDQLLEIFGEWQTMDYEPPTAENGVVPRNAFGNVELFKPCMLPKGTVHLKLPGLNKICRRMNIDCASAIVGFDFHSGWSHPTYDGFVVCEEYGDTLIAAWELEQEEIERKENEKIEKRVYGNWKKLIRGLLIRERLKAKYDFGNTSGQGGGEKRKSKGPRFCTKKRRIYSGSESESDNT